MSEMHQYFGELSTDKLIRNRYFPDFNYKGTVVEVGAATPEFLSMSQHFRLNGWRCVCVEPNPKFADLHAAKGNEIYRFACGPTDLDDQDFEVVHRGENYERNGITDHSHSSLKVKESYKKWDPAFRPSEIQTIKVNVRRLDTILSDIGISSFDFLAIDVEGWELEVMRGFTIQKYKPSLVLLENLMREPEYEAYMASVGYSLSTKLEYNFLFVPQEMRS